MLKAELIGNLGKDPEMRYLSEGTPVTQFSVACNEGRDKAPVWVRVSCWNKMAEAANEYLRKGSKVFVRGRLQVRVYTARDGDTRFSLDVVADELQFLSGRSADGPDENGASDDEP